MGLGFRSKRGAGGLGFSPTCTTLLRRQGHLRSTFPWFLMAPQPRHLDRSSAQFHRALRRGETLYLLWRAFSMEAAWQSITGTKYRDPSTPIWSR